ncbi:MAG TPA: CehA/McbA family metallohydrolase [Pirellulales bacterium]|nr:CehA/McbA family metallohydrolase [Pirellulales bacterium]
MFRRLFLSLAVVLVVNAAGMTLLAAGGGEFRITVVDAQTREPIACRMHLKNVKGVAQKVARMPFWNDHFVFPGEVKLRLPRGNYTFELDHGPEYTDRKGYFTIEDNADDEQVIDLTRAVDMAAEGWWSGDLHIHRAEKDIRLLMEAEDLHVAPLITWWNEKNAWKGKPLPKEPVVRFDGNRIYDLLGGEDERGGGALLFFNLAAPMDFSGAEREYPSSMKYLLAAREQGTAERPVWIDAEKPFWWDMPIWLASGKIDSIGLANNHMQRDGMLTNEAWGKPRDRGRFRDPHGNGEWSEEIYYHVLNCGLRIPPSAGSASGVIPNPVGYNRMYVWVDKDEFSYENWWEAFKAGRVIVTNGPLIRPFANNRLPGHVFKASAGEELQLEITLNLATRETISYMEIVKDGRVVQSVRLDEMAPTGHLPPVKFTESGWVLVRAVTDNAKTYRFASTAPWYVEFGDKPRISKQSAQFFLDWTNERAEKLKLADVDQRREVLAFIDEARQYWEQRVAEANVD